MAKQGELYYRDNALVIPRNGTLRQDIITHCHDPPARGHPCARRTCIAVERYYWWPSIKPDVDLYVATCDSCQRMKHTTRKAAGLLQPLPIPPEEHKLKSWVMDFAPALPCTENGNDQILVMVDRLTRYTLLRACPSGCTAEQVVNILQELTAPYGDPRMLVCDRDSRFKADAFKTHAVQIGCELILASVDHHETVGLAERQIRTIKTYLRHYINAEHTNWGETPLRSTTGAQRLPLRVPWLLPKLLRSRHRAHRTPHHVRPAGRSLLSQRVAPRVRTSKDAARRSTPQASHFRQQEETRRALPHR